MVAGLADDLVVECLINVWVVEECFDVKLQIKSRFDLEHLIESFWRAVRRPVEFDAHRPAHEVACRVLDREGETAQPIEVRGRLKGDNPIVGRVAVEQRRATDRSGNSGEH